MKFRYVGNGQGGLTEGGVYDTIGDAVEAGFYPVLNDVGTQIHVHTTKMEPINNLRQTTVPTEFADTTACVQSVTYREEVLRTASNPSNNVGMRLDANQTLINACLGLSGEVGEITDIVKKYTFHGQTPDSYALIKELGDIRWYLELACISVGVTMKEVELHNVAKLRKRYPEGFTEKAAQQRADEKK